MFRFTIRQLLQPTSASRSQTGQIFGMFAKGGLRTSRS
jgi:hypothetical protein